MRAVILALSIVMLLPVSASTEPVGTTFELASHKRYFPQVREVRSWLKKQYIRRQWRCLDRLWESESHWRVRARNRRTGAFGIPQANPGRKMRTAGSDWRTSAMTQVKWGRRYIRSRYGKPCKALAFQTRKGWY